MNPQRVIFTEPPNKSARAFQARFLFEFKFRGIRSFAIAQDDTYSEVPSVCFWPRMLSVKFEFDGWARAQGIV